MPGKFFIDTNIVIYALGKQTEKTAIAKRLFSTEPIISTQVLSEAANVALRKLALPIIEATALVETLKELCHIELITTASIDRAFQIADRYKFAWYDSLIVASALEAGCEKLYTEDLRHGQIIDAQLTVVNPFT